VLFMAIPPGTIGILSWLPMLRLAVRSRRGWDWFWCAVVVVIATGAFVLVGQSDDENGWQTDVGAAGLILLALGVPVYFLAVDLWWYSAHRSRTASSPTDRPGAGHPPGAPWPAAPPTLVPAPASPPAPAAPSGRIDQVRAELDELSAYLRNQEGA
jgi:hypothetical protein